MTKITAFDGGEFDGYLALPASGYGPGIVVLQEIFGVNQYLRDVADWYAAHGFVAVVPDLFWRIQPGIELSDRGDDWKRAIELYQQIDEDQAHVEGVRAHIRNRRQRVCDAGGDVLPAVSEVEPKCH